MTVPIIPGPFQFLAEAGQAAGDIGRAKEERQARAQKIAEHASTSILDAIMAGGDPAILDSPETQKTLKTAGYPPLTSAHFKFVGGAQAAAGAGGRAKIAANVPGREAAAEGGAADVSAAGSQAALDEGLPQLDAESKAYQLRAQAEGAKFNLGVYQAARTRFKDVKDPEFRRDAIDAATGVLDARIYRLRFQRENMTLQKQLIADQARSLLEARKEITGMFERANAQYDKDRTTAIVAGGFQPDDKKAVQNYEQVHPRPTYEDAENAMFKSLGITPEEYKRITREGLGLVPDKSKAGGAAGTGADTAAPSGAPASGPSSSPTMDSGYKDALNRLSNATDVELETRHFFEAVDAGVFNTYEARLLFVELKQTLPASRYRKLRDAYNKAVVAGGGTAVTEGIPTP